MKSIFESGEIMGYYAEIDLYQYFLKELYVKMKNIKPLSPIEIAIDKATGHNELYEIKKEAIKILKVIIKLKVKIDADYSADEKALIEIKKIKVKQIACKEKSYFKN